VRLWFASLVEAIARNSFYAHHLWTVFRSRNEEDILGGLLAARIKAPLLGRLFVRSEASLENDLTTLLAVLRTDGIELERHALWVTRRFLAFHDVGAAIVIHPDYRSIIVTDDMASLPHSERLWILGHELGHELGHIADHHLKRRGHPVLRLFRMNASSELVADTFAWYLLERMATFDATRPKHFDLVGFVLGKLPNLLASQPDIPSRR